MSLPYRLKRLHRMIACRLALVSSHGLALLECSTPLSSFTYVGAAPKSVLVVFLPGIGDLAEDFETRGFIDALAQSGLQADAIAVDAHYGYYARKSVLERLAHDIVLPARERGYREIWLVGVSMGGTGALSYLMQHPEQIDRVLLLAPYLGEARSRTGPPTGDDSAKAHIRSLWRQILDRDRAHATLRKLYLGYGTRDRFANVNGLLAPHLAPGHVRAIAGGHDWRTWRRLWDAFLAIWS